MKSYFTQFHIYFILLLSQSTIYAEITKAISCANFCAFQSLCVNPCDVGWVTGSFMTNGRQPVKGLINGNAFNVQRIDTGLFAITFKKPFCCPISVVATSNFQLKSSPTPTPTPKPTGACIPKLFRTIDTRMEIIDLAVSPNEKCFAVAGLMGQQSQILVYPINNPNICDIGPSTSYSLPPGFNFNFEGSTALAYSIKGCLAVTTSVADISGAKNQVALFSPNLFSQCGLIAPPQISTFTSLSTSQSSIKLAFNPSGNCLALGIQEDDNIKFLQLTNAQIGCHLPSPSPSPIATLPITIPGPFAFSPSGTCFAIIHGMANDQMSIYAESALPCIFSNPPVFTIPQTLPSDFSFSDLAFSINNCFALLEETNKEILVFELNSTNCTPSTPAFAVKLPNEVSFTFNLEYSPDGNCLAVFSEGSNSEAILSMFTVRSCGLSAATTINLEFVLNPLNRFGLKFLSNNCLAIFNGSQIHIYTLSTSGSAFSSSSVDTQLSVTTNTVANTQICEAITPGCFIVSLPPEADTCATVTFFATPCT